MGRDRKGKGKASMKDTKQKVTCIKEIDDLEVRIKNIEEIFSNLRNKKLKQKEVRLETDDETSSNDDTYSNDDKSSNYNTSSSEVLINYLSTRDIQWQIPKNTEAEQLKPLYVPIKTEKAKPLPLHIMYPHSYFTSNTLLGASSDEMYMEEEVRVMVNGKAKMVEVVGAMKTKRDIGVLIGGKEEVVSKMGVRSRKIHGTSVKWSLNDGFVFLSTSILFSSRKAFGNEGALHLGPERPRVYSDLSPKEKERYNVDIHATNILLQGLPKDIYTLINHYIDEKDIWDNVKMLLEGETIQDYYVWFAKLINDTRNIKMTMSRMQLNSKFINNMLPEWGRFITVVKLNKGLRDSNYDQLVNRIEVRGTMHGVQVQLVIGKLRIELGMHIQVKQGRLSATTATTMFMANLSSADPVYDEAGPSYDSDILSDIHNHDHYQDAFCEHHEVHKIHNDVQPNYIVDSHADYTSDSNMISYDQYVKDNAVTVGQVELYERRAKFELKEREQNIDKQLRIVITDRNIKEENLKKELHSVKTQLSSTINHNKSMVEEVTSLKKDFIQKENKYLEEFLDMKSLKEKVEDKLYKQDQSLQTVYMLCKPKSYYDEQNNVDIGYKKPLYLTRAQQVQPALYNGNEIVKTNHVSAIMHNSGETLEIAEITRNKTNDKMKDPECVKKKVKIAPHDYSKENYLATFTPQTQLTPEQIFWSKDLLKMKKKLSKRSPQLQDQSKH
uniref:Integrase, catalytic region, zinc finger, CCHC-type, peptidase aspartic, catalytic n=1 Tax=Tanacetum cinerariifolium TaxID=118510 RepID=A0A6L2NUY1_TANCI|nr:hypothetical protein [Tanacetum cinerariifolium]